MYEYLFVKLTLDLQPVMSWYYHSYYTGLLNSFSQ